MYTGCNGFTNKSANVVQKPRKKGFWKNDDIRHKRGEKEKKAPSSF